MQKQSFQRPAFRRIGFNASDPVVEQIQILTRQLEACTDPAERERLEQAIEELQGGRAAA